MSATAQTVYGNTTKMISLIRNVVQKYSLKQHCRFLNIKIASLQPSYFHEKSQHLVMCLHWSAKSNHPGGEVRDEGQICKKKGTAAGGLGAAETAKRGGHQLKRWAAAQETDAWVRY